MRRRDAFLRALHVSTVRFPSAIQSLFSVLSRPFRNANILQTELLSSPFSGKQYLLSTRNLEKKIVDEAKNVFALCFFSADFGKSKNEIVLVAGEGKKDDVGERERLLAGRRQRRDEEGRARAPQEPRTCCC